MKNYHIKAYEWQIATWEIAAIDAEVSTSQWVRGALDSVANETVHVPFGETEMLRGRLPDREEIARSFQFRVTEWELQEWKQSADAEGLLIGEWCRQALDYCAKSATIRKVG